MGLIFVGLRVKRETPEENAGIFDALAAATPVVNVDIPDLLYLCDPFDGQNRHLPAGVFMAPILALQCADAGPQRADHGPKIWHNAGKNPQRRRHRC